MGDWAFQYDTLNRLTVAAPALNAPTSYQKSVGCFNYDGFGNRTLAAFTTSSDCTRDTTATASYNSSNQVSFVSQAAPIATSAPSGFSYDSGGNVIADANNSYAYDGEGRLCAVYNSLTKSYTRYIYDASGGRVGKATFTGTFPAKNTVCAASGAAAGFALTAQYLLDQGGDQVTELNTSSGTMAWAHSNVWAGSHLDATYDRKGLHFHLADPLGTRRIQTNIDGAVEYSFQSLPFGDNFASLPTALATSEGIVDATENHFTGKEHDAESGNDYFGARYYNSTMGRFMSPDWSAKIMPVPYAKLDNPQTLNLYAYVMNNPLSRIDPSGHYTCKADTTSCASIEAARQEALKSTDRYVVAAAAALGSPTDSNKIFVGTSSELKAGENGKVEFGLGSDGKADGTVHVTIAQKIVDAVGEKLEATVAHEGSHAKDDKKLIDSGYNKKNNITKLTSEERAYSVENSVNEEHNVSTSAISSPQAIDKFVLNHPDLYPDSASPILAPANNPNSH